VNEKALDKSVSSIWLELDPPQPRVPSDGFIERAPTPFSHLHLSTVKARLR